MGSTAAGSATGLTDYPLEREAVQRVLQSGIFDRAPNLALILRYVCERFFDGRLEEIREYNIAVDALGRPPDFDQKRDSIVRVEAHRLRKRLAEYYQNAGQNDSVVIQIPAGTYVPQFVPREPAAPATATQRPEVPAAAAVIELPPPETERVYVPASAPIGFRPAFHWGVLLAALLAIGALLVYAVRRPASSDSGGTLSRAAAVPSPIVAGEEVRLAAGGDRQRIIDHGGDVWLPERFVTGGEVKDAPTRPIARTLDPALYLHRREGTFQYDIPVSPGPHEVRLHFAETVFGEGNVAGGGESSRVFAIRINGSMFLAMDVVANAGGPNTAYVRVIRDVEPTADGKIHLQFAPLAKEQAFVNAIEIVRGMPGRLYPIRLLPRTTPFVDSTKREWLPDACVDGGQIVQRHEPVAGAEKDSELFQSERYGNFVYSIPVDTRGKYTVTLGFAESWFGPGRPGGGGVGSRRFDIYSGGRTLLRNFDILKEAGGPLRAVSKTFRGLEPNAQGKLVLQFVPVENYALVNSIEVVDEGR